MRTLSVVLGLLLTGCASQAVVTMPLGQFAYTLGEMSQRVETLCATKKITAADCTRFREVTAAAKARIDAPPSSNVDWAEVLNVISKLAVSGAL